MVFSLAPTFWVTLGEFVPPKQRCCGKSQAPKPIIFAPFLPFFNTEQIFNPPCLHTLCEHWEAKDAHCLCWRPPGLPWAPSSCYSMEGPRKTFSPLQWSHPCCCSPALLAMAVPGAELLGTFGERLQGQAEMQNRGSAPPAAPGIGAPQCPSRVCPAAQDKLCSPKS